MLRNCRRILHTKSNFAGVFLQKQTFLTNEYKCNDAWTSQTLSSVSNKINLNDFYNIIDQNYSSKGVISAIDVDIFSNSLKDSFHLDELKDLLHKLRLSAETGNMLESTHQATIRNYLQFGAVEDLISILKDPLNFGVFLDEYTANILLDKLVTSCNFEQAANVASLIMLQEDNNNEITSALCQYACFKYIMDYIKPPEPEVITAKSKKVEEFKIRIKFLRNPYFDDHFDIKDIYTLSGKTLAWMSEKSSENIKNNLQIIGWLVYRKYDKLLNVCQKTAKLTSSKIYGEVIDLIKRDMNYLDTEAKATLSSCISILEKTPPAKISLEESIKNEIENAINKEQTKDIQAQQKVCHHDPNNIILLCKPFDDVLCFIQNITMAVASVI